MGTGLFTPTHLIFLFLLALLLFGAKRLPEIGRSLGVGMREFKDSVTGLDKTTETRSELPPPTPAGTPGTGAATPPAQEPVAADPPRETENVS